MVAKTEERCSEERKLRRGDFVWMLKIWKRARQNHLFRIPRKNDRLLIIKKKSLCMGSKKVGLLDGPPHAKLRLRNRKTDVEEKRPVWMTLCPCSYNWHLLKLSAFPFLAACVVLSWAGPLSSMARCSLPRDEPLHCCGPCTAPWLRRPRGSLPSQDTPFSVQI